MELLELLEGCTFSFGQGPELGCDFLGFVLWELDALGDAIKEPAQDLFGGSPHAIPFLELCHSNWLI